MREAKRHLRDKMKQARIIVDLERTLAIMKQSHEQTPDLAKQVADLTLLINKRDAAHPFLEFFRK